MQWKGRRGSDNVEDRRASAARGGGRGPGGGGINLLLMIASRFGIKGILIALLGMAILWGLGVVDPSHLLQGGSRSAPVSVPFVESAEERELFEFVRVVLAGTEDVWAKEFSRLGRQYQPPTLVVYRGLVQTACGGGAAAMGPFYCPADRKIHIDLSFYDELADTFKAAAFSGAGKAAANRFKRSSRG